MARLPLRFSLHATKRMAQCGISVADVRAVVDGGDVIEDYPNDTPFPSRLMLGWHAEGPIHVVAADNPAAGETLIITVYQPNPALWTADFRTRKP